MEARKQTHSDAILPEAQHKAQPRFEPWHIDPGHFSHTDDTLAGKKLCLATMAFLFHRGKIVRPVGLPVAERRDEWREIAVAWEGS